MLNSSPIFTHMEADYLDVGTEAEPRVEPMRYFTVHNESPSAQTTGKQYVGDKTVTTLTTSYATSFPFEMDEFSEDPVCAFIRDVAEEQRLGVACSYYKVRLYQPAGGEPNSFYCRRFSVGFAIDNIVREAGAIKRIEGSLNALSDAEVGVFNTVTRVFTPAEWAAKDGI